MYRIGIDLGGTNIAAGIINENFEIICQASTPTGSDRSSDEITADMIALCHTLCEKSGIPAAEIASVGIAAPGIDTMLHKADEFIPLDDFDKLVELYTLAIVRLCVSDPL